MSLITTSEVWAGSHGVGPSSASTGSCTDKVDRSADTQSTSLGGLHVASLRLLRFSSAIIDGALAWLYRFAVLIIPTYVDPRDAQSNPFRSTSTLAIDSDPELHAEDDGEHLQGEGERKNSWRWFHTVNRVCSGVKKVRHPFLSFLPPHL